MRTYQLEVFILIQHQILVTNLYMGGCIYKKIQL